jgi:hypothetical protein
MTARRFADLPQPVSPKHCPQYCRTLIRTVVIVFALFGVAVLAAADSLPASIQTTETMMNTAGFDVLGIALVYGIDPFAVLRFSSYIDPGTGVFSYSLLPGQTYLGNPLSLSTVATYNSGTSTYLQLDDDGSIR